MKVKLYVIFLTEKCAQTNFCIYFYTCIGRHQLGAASYHIIKLHFYLALSEYVTEVLCCVPYLATSIVLEVYVYI